MNGLLVLIRKDLLEQLRTKKLLVLGIVFLFIAIASPIIAKLTPELLKTINVPGLVIKLPEPTFKDSIDQFIKNISQIGLLAIVFITAGAVSDEKARRTLEIVLTKPVSRNNFIISKFLSNFITIAGVFIASCVVFYLYTVTTFTTFSFVNFFLATLTLLIYVLTIAAVTIMVSSFVSNSIVAGCIGFVFYLLMGLAFNFSEAAQNLSPNTIITEFQNIAQKGFTGNLLPPILTMTAIIILSVTLSVTVFRRQEIER